MSPAKKKPAAKKPSSGLLDEIRGRRETTSAQALGLLELSASSDRESKVSLLSMAARHLADAKVCGRWVELADAEEDTDLRDRMIAALAHADHRQIPDLGAWIRLLIDALGADATRDVAIGALGRLVAADADAVKALVEAYRGEKAASRQRAILSALCSYDDPPPAVAKLLTQVLGRVDADVKPALVSRLLRKDAFEAVELKRLLAPTEPVAVRRMILGHLVDRSIPMDRELADVIAKDPDAGCRLAAIQALASRGSSSKALLDVVLRDAREEVRAEALIAFQHSLDLTPAVRKQLVEALPDIRTAGLLQTLLGLLVPHIGRDAGVRKGLLDLLKRNVKGDLAATAGTLLGRTASWDPALMEELLKSYEAESDDRVRAALIAAFAGVPAVDPRLTKLLVTALKAPEPAIRTWAAKGILHLPLNESNVATLAGAADVLLDRDVDPQVRLDLARKIVRIPAKPPKLLETLKLISQRATDKEMADLARRAYDEEASKSETREIDWAAWLRQIDVERNAEGVFPDLFMHYDSNPDMARKVIRAALNPDVNLYQVYGYDVSALSLITFLVSRNAVDDDIVRYCIHHCLNKDSSHGEPDNWLAPLFSNPGFSGLKDELWTICEKRTDGDPVLKRELLRTVAGGDDALAADFRKRIKAKETETAILPYATLLAGNLAWEPAAGLLDEIAKRHPSPESKDLSHVLDEAFKSLGREKPAKAPENISVTSVGSVVARGSPMSDLKALLKLALDASNTTSERIASLRKLKEFLKDEEVVRELLALLASDPSVDLRRALLEILSGVDLTRLKDRAGYLEAFGREAAMEPERDLRLMAVRRLAALAMDSGEVAELLRASLEYDLDEEIQGACLAGLSTCARLPEPIGAFLADFALRSPKTLRQALADILPRLDPESGERLAVALLRPWESPALKKALLTTLSEKPSLSAASIKALTAFAGAEPEDEIRGQAVALIGDLRKVDPALFAQVLEWVAAVPARAGLLELLRNRLSSQAGLVDQLAALFDGAKSTGLKLAILDLLKKADVPALWAKALRDASPWVRSAAIGLAVEQLPRHADLEPAIAGAMGAEPVAELRMRMAVALTGVRQKGAALEALLLERLEKEADPRIGGVLAAAVAGIAVTDANRAAILKAYRRILLDPYADPKVSRIVTDRLRAFAYRDEPELVRSLTALLERATEIEQVDDLHEHLRRLQPDLAPIRDLVTTLLYRFIHHYPRGPLDTWVREIHDGAKRDDALRARIPWIVKLTGATWALDAAGTTEQASTFMTSMLDALKGKGGFRGANNLLREAWEKRLLKKADAAALFRRLLHGKDEGVFQELAKILKEGKLVTPELIDASFSYLKRFPNGGYAYEIQKYLGETAAGDPAFRERMRAALTAADYAEYARICGRPKDVKVPPRTWNDWEYSGWRTMYPDWPILKLAEEADLDDLLLETLATPPASGGTGTLHYAILDHFWRSPGRDWGGYNKRSEERKLAELRAFGGLTGTAGPLGDRAILLFKKRWEEFTSDAKRVPPPGLKEAASETYAGLCRLHATLGAKEKTPFPPPLKQMDAARLEKLWPLDGKLWDSFKVQHLATSTPEEEAAAAKLAGQAQDAMNRGRLDEIHPAIAELMSAYRHTAFVRTRAKNFEFMLDKFDPAKPSPADHEKKAESMWETVTKLDEKGDRGEAKAFLNDLLQRYWRSDFVKRHKAGIEDLRTRLG